MRAQALTPADIFGYHVRYVVPLFQRPYVWNQQDQWEPLWDDVRAVAERLLRLWPVLSQPGNGLLAQVANGDLARLVAPHFLGAIVVEQAPTLVGSIQVYHVIDGQQRLTTLQLLLDAASRVAEKYGDPDDARRLRQLVRNDPAVRRDDEFWKVWPTIGDRDAYLATMSGAPAGNGAVVAAHAFFADAIEAWAQEEGDAGVRLHVLAEAIAGHLRAVVIHLDPGDNPQGIFETLNHRGAPLLAADLIKNLVFRVAQADGFDVVALYQKYWADLDGPYWRAYVRRGRQVVPRIDVFVHYWLIMRLVREVRADQIFASFRDHLASAGPHVEELLGELRWDARSYAAIDAVTSARSYPVEVFCYRVFGALDAGAVTPFYLWLMRWPQSQLPIAERDRALAAMESWLVRRWLAGLSTKDNSNVVLDLIRALDAAGPHAAGYVTETFLYEQKSGSRLWPGDDVVRKALKSAPLDPRALRPRLRMLFEAIEDRRREDLGESSPCERDLGIEYVMPVEWRTYWSGPAVTASAASTRDTLTHTLGNLTPVRWKLDADVASLPWTDDAAQAASLSLTGKRTELAKHDRLLVNADLVADYPDDWTETSIVARTAQLADIIVRVWTRPQDAPAPHMAPVPDMAPAPHMAPAPLIAKVPGQREVVNVRWNVWSGEVFHAHPVGHLGDELSYRGPLESNVDIMDDDGGGLEDEEVPADLDPVSEAVDDQLADSDPDTDTDTDADSDTAGVAGGSRYALLAQFLAAQTADTVPMTFEQVEDIMQEALPASARTSIPFWSSTNVALGRAIVSGGFKPTNVDLWNERVIFARDMQNRRPRKPKQARRRGSRQGGLDR